MTHDTGHYSMELGFNWVGWIRQLGLLFLDGTLTDGEYHRLMDIAQQHI